VIAPVSAPGRVTILKIISIRASRSWDVTTRRPEHAQTPGCNVRYRAGILPSAKFQYFTRSKAPPCGDQTIFIGYNVNIHTSQRLT